MIISLIGYMGSGKSHISKILSKELHFKRIDLDQKIISQEGISILEIFQKKGEIYFRKIEREILEQILTTEKNIVLSVGGGTPAYYNNMELINKHSTSIFLQTSVGILAQRLMRNKEKRPLIAKIPTEDLHEFIAKHLFERNVFYHQARHTISTNDKSTEDIIKEIASFLKI